MSPQQQKQQLIAHIRNLQEAILVEKSAVEQLMTALRQRFNVRWPNITIHAHK